MSRFAGQGDAERTLRLLWRANEPPTRPGPKSDLTIDSIVDVAIEIADTESLDRLSMRAIGDRLGRSGMAAYSYVAGKSELIDLMYDRVHAELPTEYPLSGGWRAALSDWAEDLWRLYVRHPWMLRLSFARPVMGPRQQDVYETGARLVFEIGLDTSVARRMVGVVFHLVRATAQTAADSRVAAAETGTADTAWWSRRRAVLGALVPDFAERFPYSVLLAPTDLASPDPARSLERDALDSFRVGLAVFLDGLDAQR